MKMQALTKLRALLNEVPPRLSKLPPSQTEGKPSPSKWSPKEELGHLLDSAANNHQRIVRTQLEDKPKMPGYDGNAWVKLHGYQQRNWQEMIELWRALNRQLLSAAEAVPDDGWSRTCTIADSQPLTLKFVFEDYIEHMMHHLKHIGIAMDDLKPKA
ncbi:MAG TPA: DinB family protein [Terriglobales bacterium]|nr:DinB family protein [Terriglobales bacterium]